MISEGVYSVSSAIRLREDLLEYRYTKYTNQIAHYSVSKSQCVHRWWTQWSHLLGFT